MRTISTAITQRAQTTIPAEVRSRLGLGAHDRLEWVIEDDTIVVRAPKYKSIGELFGSVKPLGQTVDFDDQIDAAIEEHVAEKLRKMRAE